MKEKNSSSVSTALNVRAVLIRKNSPEEKILVRLREYLQYYKLKRLLEAYPLQMIKPKVCEEKAMEVDVKPWEIPEDYSDHEEISNTKLGSDGSMRERREKNDEDYEIEVEEEEESKEFIPSIKINKIDDLLLISTLVLKDVALTSTLFSILEEDKKLDILSENHYRTETKVAHTIQVKIKPDFKVDELEKKLLIWATKTS